MCSRRGQGTVMDLSGQSRPKGPGIAEEHRTLCCFAWMPLPGSDPSDATPGTAATE